MYEYYVHLKKLLLGYLPLNIFIYYVRYSKVVLFDQFSTLVTSLRMSGSRYSQFWNAPISLYPIALEVNQQNDPSAKSFCDHKLCPLLPIFRKNSIEVLHPRCNTVHSSNDGNKYVICYSFREDMGVLCKEVSVVKKKSACLPLSPRSTDHMAACPQTRSLRASTNACYNMCSYCLALDTIFTICCVRKSIIVVSFFFLCP